MSGRRGRDGVSAPESHAMGVQRRLDGVGEVVGRRLVRAVFGDRRGVAVFLATVLFVSLYRRIEISSNDTSPA